VFQTEDDLRRIPLSRRSHIIGFQPLPTGTAEHESALERDFVTLASFGDAGAKVTAQPVTIRFVQDGQSRRYTPDFRVAWSGGRSELIEVKYRADLRAGWVRFKPAFAAARSWGSEHGTSFRIVTERSVRGPMLDAAKRLLPLRSAPIDTVLADEVLMIARSLEHPTFGTIVDRLPASRAAALAVVWRLIARGALRVDLSIPIDLSATMIPT
jgi:TnsA endonuclease N terminal